MSATFSMMQPFSVVLSCSALARNLSCSLNLLFSCNLPIRWALCVLKQLQSLSSTFDPFWMPCSLGSAHTHVSYWTAVLSSFHSRQHHPLYVLISEHTHISCNSCAVLLALLKFRFPLCAVKGKSGILKETEVLIGVAVPDVKDALLCLCG